MDHGGRTLPWPPRKLGALAHMSIQQNETRAPGAFDALSNKRAAAAVRFRRERSIRDDARIAPA
jgi:hypothetical protein